MVLAVISVACVWTCWRCTEMKMMSMVTGGELGVCMKMMVMIRMFGTWCCICYLTLWCCVCTVMSHIGSYQ